MTLLDYLRTFPADERKAFAIRCGTTPKYMMKIAYGYADPGESLSVNIDRESSGAVPCEELCPNMDWAYLRKKFSTTAAARRKRTGRKPQ